MIGLEQILGFIGVKPEAVAQLRAMITPEKVEAGLAQLKALEGRLTALEASTANAEKLAYEAVRLLYEIRDRTPNQLAPPPNPLSLWGAGVHEVTPVPDLPTNPQMPVLNYAPASGEAFPAAPPLEYAPQSPGMVVDTTQHAPFDTSAGAQVASREGETIPKIFQVEMDKRLALVLRENGVFIDDNGSDSGSVGNAGSGNDFASDLGSDGSNSGGGG